MSEKNDQKTHDEIRREIQHEMQVERMILFSDAVFAIVLTLMAIEIHLPDTEHRLSAEEFNKAMFHLIPVFIAYVASFFFIGTIWYQHLKLFGLIKKFDKGLVIRNFILFFFVGLFPFAATAISKVNAELTETPVCIYLFVILASISAFASIQQYLLIKHPEFLDVEEVPLDELKNFYEKKVMITGMALVLVGYLITMYVITDPVLISMSGLWWLAVPLIQIFGKRFAKKKIEAEKQARSGF